MGIETILSIGFAGILYCLYQLLRNQKVYEIRIKWIRTQDKRYGKYSYSEMFVQSAKNWFGFRWPKDEHYG